MPTIWHKHGGYIILSRIGRRNITHQLSERATKMLADRFRVVTLDRLTIDVPTLLELKDKGFAYTKREERERRRRERQPLPPATLFDPPVAAPVPAAAPVAASAPADLRSRCPSCLSEMVREASYCARCGHHLGARAASRDIVVIVLVGGLFLAFVLIVWMIVTQKH